VEAKGNKSLSIKTKNQMKTKLISKYWKNERLFRFINGDYSFLQVYTSNDFAGIEKREYPISGIDDCFNPDSGWQPCTQDEFVQAYCKSINLISVASGIEHLPLIMQPDFLNESNPES